MARRIAEQGNDAEIAKQTLITANLRLGRFHYKQYSYRGMPLPDLVQEGNIGLIRAAKSLIDLRIQVQYIRILVDSTKHCARHRKSNPNHSSSDLQA